MDFPKNCENYDYFPPMVNCGLACAANNQACGASIGDMAANVNSINFNLNLIKGLCKIIILFLQKDIIWYSSISPSYC